MYSRPRTYHQRCENRDDAAADASQDRVDFPDPRSREEIDNAYWEDIRQRMINIGGFSPDQADVRILMLRGKRGCFNGK